MTAGSGIIHQEMPKGDKDGAMHGFQLWANLPSSQKMTTPRYQDIKSQEISEMVDDDGSKIRIIAGNYRGYKGPVDGIAADPQYLDVTLPPRCFKRFPFDTRRQGFAYIFQGSARFKDASNPFGVKVEKEFQGEELEIRDLSGNRTLVVFGAGDEVAVTSGNEGVRFLLISGAPLREPVAWHGPIVMNTQAELQTAMRELNNGTFIKTGAAVILFDVKTPAAETGFLSSVATSARSSSLLLLIPLATPLAEKPSTLVTVMGLFRFCSDHHTRQVLVLYLHTELPGPKHLYPNCLLHKIQQVNLFLDQLLQSSEQHLIQKSILCLEIYH